MPIIACLNPDAEEYLRDIYSFLLKNIPQDTVNQLLLQESESRMRPVEMTAKNGTLGLFQDFFETKDVYLTTEFTDGVQTIEYYDITEYESMYGKRRILNLLSLLTALDRNALRNKYIHEVLKKQYTQEWIYNKCRKNRIVLVLWLILRLIFAAVFIIFDNSMIVT